MAKFVIDFTNKVDESYDHYDRIFMKIAKRAARTLHFNRHFFIVEVMFVLSAEIQALNKATRAKNHVTDVLSFSYYAKEALVPAKLTNGIPINLGSIVINVEKADEQAKQYGHTLERELKFLYVHGLLHLFGYDHETAAEEAEMIQLQNTIIGKRKVI